MTNPLTLAIRAGAEPRPMRGYLATCTAVDTTTALCAVDTGDGVPLTGILYLGRPPQVGRQVLYVTFNRTAVVLGGDA